ncbi:MFS transporter [Mycolicibacterium sp. BiH015]|uniref:MFS transporter n=1 Tax=Mycolicibacterium sp. BiH015 TaxID=3018808 RepID=UPI0022E891B6|nr:MFS transporter [Mycolicibacterium sp. BiH015]MDA2893234.1 MFS transporter [Mycolicibacterium sp. BiH015]
MSETATQQDIASSANWRTLLGRRFGPVSSVLAGGVGLHATNVYLAATVMPSVVADIGGAALYAWATTVFMIVSLIGSVLAGAVLGRIGPRAAYRWTAAILTAGTVLCALAPSMPVLLVGRAIQGLGGGLLFALCYSIVRVALPSALWPRAMALVSAMWGVATLIGPALGGLWAQLEFWRGAFWMLVPIAAVFGVLASTLPQRSGEPASRRVPWMSMGLLTAAVLIMSIASVTGSLTINGIGVLLAVALLIVWLFHERRTGTGVLPRATFGPGRRLALIYLTSAMLVIASTVEVFVPYFGQHLQGLNPLAAGYLGAIMAAGWTIGSVAFSGVTLRTALLIGWAPASSVLGLLLLVAAGPRQSGAIIVVLTVGLGLLLLGLGIGAAWPHLLTAVLKLAGDKDQDLAGASATTIQLGATAIGSALAGTVTNIASFTDPTSTADAAQWLFAIFIVPALIALSSAWFARR